MLLLFLRASRKRQAFSIFLIILLISLSLVYNLQYAKAGILTVAANRVSNSTPGATGVQYLISWTFPAVENVQCMQIAITTSTASPSAVPTGLVTTSAVKPVGGLSGGGLTDTNYALYNTVNGVLQYEYATGQNTTATPIAIQTNNITNPSSSGIYYAQIRTYTGLSGHICTGQTSFVTVAFAMTAGQALSVNVDPSMTFSVSNLGFGQAINGVTTNIDISTASANTIPIGRVNPSFDPIVGQSLTVSTNAVNGYTVYASDSAQLNDGNGHTIADWTGTNGTPTTFPAPGTTAFGYTTSSTTLSGTGARFQTNKWAGFRQWGDEVARKATKASSDVTNVGIQIGVDGVQEAGTYTTTIIYIATPTY